MVDKLVYFINRILKNKATRAMPLIEGYVYGHKGKQVYFINQIFGRKNEGLSKKICDSVTKRGLNRLYRCNTTLKNMKSLLLSFFLTAVPCSCIAVAAAEYSVSGRIVEADGGEACPGASFMIYDSSDTLKPVSVNAADMDGRFRHQLPKAGKYLLKTGYAGLIPATRWFAITAEAPCADLGTIALVSDSETLGEVVVTGQRKLVESDGATLTYNVDEDPSATTSSTLDMLRKVPMVTVDAQENIKVRGQSNFKIYLNGKEDPMLSGDPKTILKSMPASTIRRIEVITEPGAKYDAEGTGGILNIITVGKQNLDGFMANFSLWNNVRNSGVSGYGRTKIGNVTASLSANYNDSRVYPSRHAYTTQIYENFLSETDRTQREESKSSNNWNYVGSNFNLSWEPDTLNLLTLSFDFGRNLSWQDTRNVFSMTSASGERQWGYVRDWNSHGSYLGLHGQVSYQHTFRRQGHHIVASYLYNNYGNDFSSVQHRHSAENISLPWLWGRNVNDNSTGRHTVQIDYTNPFNSRHTLEAGAKLQLQRSTGNSYPFYGNEYDDMALQEEDHVKMVQFQDILALYASYTGSFGSFSGRVGVRWEYTHTGIDYKIRPRGYEDFTTVLNDIVPNASLTYRFTPASNLRLAYQMRIFRPGLWQLNPYRNEMTTNQASYGNPDLDSGHNNQVSVTYSNFGGKVGGNVGVAYAYTSNSIESYEFIRDGIFNSTYANIGRYQWFNINGYLQWTIITDMQFSLYARANYEDYKVSSPELKAANAGWSGSFNANFDYTLPCRLRLSAFGGAGSKWIMLQQSGSGWYYYGVQASRSFLKDDALTVNVYAQQFAHPRDTSTTTVEAPGMRTYSRTDFAQWHLGIGLSFRFGSLSSDVKRTAANLGDDGGAQTPGKGR